MAPLVLLAPGYAISAALFPRGTIGPADRIVYSFAFSVSAAGIGGLVTQTAFGLDDLAWLLLLAGIGLAAAFVAWARGRTRVRGDPAPHGLSLPTALGAAAFLAALAIAGVAVGIASHDVHEQRSRQRFASLWALRAGEPGIVEAGVWNHGGPATYRLKVDAGGAVAESLRLRLVHNQRWHAVLGHSLSPGAPPLRLTLYRGTRPYRTVELAAATDE